MNSITRAQQEPFWLRPLLSWYCPRYCHTRSFLPPQVPGWEGTPGKLCCQSGATLSPITPPQWAESDPLATNEPETGGRGKKMSPCAPGMLSDAGEVVEGVAEQKKRCFIRGLWARMLPALLSSGRRAGGSCCGGGWRQPHVPGLISHPSSSPCAGWCKSSVSFGAGGTVTALSLVTLLPALPGPAPALEQLSLQTCHLPRGDSEGLVLLGVAVAWLLLTRKSQVWGHPCDTSGVSCPSWQLGPCLAMQERAGTEPSHCPQPLSPATVPSHCPHCPRLRAPVSYRHCHLVAPPKGTRGL